MGDNLWFLYTAFLAINDSVKATFLVWYSVFCCPLIYFCSSNRCYPSLYLIIKNINLRLILVKNPYRLTNVISPSKVDNSQWPLYICHLHFVQEHFVMDCDQRLVSINGQGSWKQTNKYTTAPRQTKLINGSWGLLEC